MLRKSLIQGDIKALEVFFNSTTDQFQQRCYAKLALLEFCGWIEVTIDEIANKYCLKRSKKTEIMEECIKIIKQTHSFKYHKFKDLFIKTIGMVNFLVLEEKVIKKIGQKKFNKFLSALQTVGVERDKYAHTNLGQVQFLNAPSYILLQWFNDVYSGLQAFDSLIAKIP